MRLKFLIFFLSLFFALSPLYSQIDAAHKKASWIFIIGNEIIFPYELPDTVKIAVYGKNSPVYKALQDMHDERNIQGRPYIVDNITRISLLEGYNIVYLDESKNDFVESVFNKLKGTGTLLITYKNPNEKFLMINLLLEGLTKQFQIQSSNLFDENLKATDKLLSMGGTKIDLQGLYEKKEKQLSEKERELIEKEKLLAEQQKIQDSLKAENERQRLENEEKSKLIEEKTQALIEEQQNAQKLLEQVAQQEQVLKKNQFILGDLNQQIQEKQELIKQQNDELEKKKQEIIKKQQELADQQKRIDEQKAVLKTQSSQIQTQQGIITITVIFVLIFFVLSIIIWRSLRQNKKITRQLQEKNNEIEQQKDALKKQAVQLEEFNKELSKLSLVASKTDNSVIIMDKDGNFEWVNSGFTRIYGYTLQLLINERGKNLTELNQERISLIKECVEKKKTVIYQAKNKTRTGKEIWVQTALTPVLDENDEVIKLIAIESDITKLKEQEYEIKQKNEELQMQKAELQAQKDLLEEVNHQIRDSINYAQTIQSAILPLEKDISQYFEHFMIYLPRDIVSGDFYWFSHPQENVFYCATVDCTGHGVPGAFMSLISSRMLDEIVSIRKIYDTGEILNTLNQMIVRALSQETTNNRDGMDLAMVKITNKGDTFEIDFAGAKRPLIYYSKQENKLQVIKGDRRSIGGVLALSYDFHFNSHKISLKKGDLLYLSTDGLIDQNNQQRKRFGTPRFMQLIEQITQLTLSEQKIKILMALNEYKGEEEQRDDITVWGLKL